MFSTELPKPSPAQSFAIRAIDDWWHDHSRREFYLAGYAGTGKTTTAAVAINRLGLADYVACGAFTGKAANVLRQRGVDAGTIHSMLYKPRKNKITRKVEFILDRHGKAAKSHLIVLDECSMVGEDIAYDLRSVADKILVLGDPGQLPPIRGAGAFTSREPDAFLSEIHRQAEGSPIIQLATLARQGKPLPIGDYGDGVRVLPLTKETQREIYREDTQAICGVHRVRWAYTQRIRKLRGFEGPIPCPGERIICKRNCHDLGIFNGGLGTVLECEPGEGDLLEMSVQMDDLDEPLHGLDVHPYLFRQHFIGPTQRPFLRRGVHEFDWGYMLTGHSAQGSGWPDVTVVDDSRSFREDRDKWMYTCLTRSSARLTVLLRD